MARGPMLILKTEGGAPFPSVRALLEAHFGQHRNHAIVYGDGGNASTDRSRNNHIARTVYMAMALRRLDAAQLELLRAVFGEGRSESALADRAGVTTRTIGRRVGKAMQAVRFEAVTLGLMEDGRP